VQYYGVIPRSPLVVRQVTFVPGRTRVQKERGLDCETPGSAAQPQQQQQQQRQQQQYQKHLAIVLAGRGVTLYWSHSHSRFLFRIDHPIDHFVAPLPLEQILRSLSLCTNEIKITYIVFPGCATRPSIPALYILSSVFSASCRPPSGRLDKR
jgi:hypothetical protein